MISHWLLRKVEDTVKATVHDNFPIDWREEFLVRTLLRSLRDKFKVLHLESLSVSAKVGWSVYQNHGAQETKFGDIGLLVRFAYKDGRTIEGVAYLEAKKRTRGRDTFDEIRVPQLKKIVKHAPRANLLLLDYAGIFGFPMLHKSIEWLEVYFDEPSSMQHTFVTYAATIPINTALALTAKDTRLYSSCTPFSHQLLLRYLQGLDLEFDKASVDAAKGFADKIGAPHYLLVINVVQVGAPDLPALTVNQAYLRPADI